MIDVRKNRILTNMCVASLLFAGPELGHFTFVKSLHLADLITMMNAFCGIVSIQTSLRFCLDPERSAQYLWIAMGLVPLGLFFDFFDGKVARWRKKTSLLGQELDSLADLISFGVAPSAIAFAIGFRTLIDSLILTFWVICGVARLARFNANVNLIPKDKSGKASYFEGTPIPTSLILVAIMAFWNYNGLILDAIPLDTVAKGTEFELHPVLIIFILHGCAMVSKTLRIPKP